ncbi:hypothetical protein GV829_10090 [Sphingomonas lacunae]|uniref:Uncharacterized protein n=1 Tax=Sphingomonas lacunae TaxID=2698828 RepID=A0A6M4AUD1_9SPHN|nr:hypothetical protein [Sphingomonas lacunae]QJQ32747.1 hypothetical protein GV829_10090 [Sphingomonas lacunae]
MESGKPSIHDEIREVNDLHKQGVINDKTREELVAMAIEGDSYSANNNARQLGEVAGWLIVLFIFFLVGTAVLDLRWDKALLAAIVVTGGGAAASGGWGWLRNQFDEAKRRARFRKHQSGQ